MSETLMPVIVTAYFAFNIGAIFSAILMLKSHERIDPITILAIILFGMPIMLVVWLLEIFE